MYKITCTIMLVCILFTTNSTTSQEVILTENIPQYLIPEDALTKLSLSKENVYIVMNHYDIKFQDIVYRQILLETGHFKSKGTKRGNLLGIYNSKKKSYYRYKHWSESIKVYATKIQNRYKYDSTHTDKDYYNFLKKIKYAKDKKYIYKLKRINHGI